MIKERRYGKYVGQKQGTNKKYMLVAVNDVGVKSILPVEADSKPDAVKKIKKRGFKEIVKGSVWREEQFETRRALGASEATTESGWKRINALAEKSERKKRESKS